MKQTKYQSVHVCEVFNDLHGSKEDRKLPHSLCLICTLFIVCKTPIPILLLVLDKLSFSSKLFRLSNSYTLSVTSNYSSLAMMMAKQKRSWIMQKRI